MIKNAFKETPMFYIIQTIFYIALLFTVGFFATHIGDFEQPIQNGVICGMPLFFILYHQIAKIRYKQDFHFWAIVLLPVVLGKFLKK